MAFPQIVPSDATARSYAGVGARIAAHLIDLLILLCMLLLVAVIMKILRATGLWSAASDAGVTPEQQWRALGLGAKLLVVGAWVLASGPLYFIFFEASPWQATIGKRMLRMRVTDDGGRRITLNRSSKRWFVRWFCDFFGGSFVSLVTMTLSKRRKALHDGVAGTVVLRGEPSNAASLEPWRFAVGLALADLLIIAIFMRTL